MKHALREHWLLPAEPFRSYAEYRAATGPSAVERARAASPEQLLAEIQESGLRGRGGAGFPTGTKWKTIQRHPCPTRDVVCNAAEGEPGTFKDRWLLRSNPYAIVEGLLIAARVVGARAIYVAAKASFARELERLRAALDEMAAVIGPQAIQVVEGPEEYLFGEEKALLQVIEGNEPMPREEHYPPYEVGLFAGPGSPNPALVNNAETFAHVPGIVRAGAPSFRALGTADTPGTCLYTISGDVRRPGVYELEAGTSLRELLYGAAGGPLGGHTFKAVLSGTASAVILPERFDTPADFGSLHLIGSGLGSAGFVVYDDRRSAPRIAQWVARFLYVESCNQCTACKRGLRVASGALDDLFDPAQATPDDFERALYGARSAPQGNRCYLPVQASLLLPSLLKAFKAEFDALLEHPGEPAEPLPTPKLVDYDPAAHIFKLDASQARKRPDWTYADPQPDLRRARPAPTPSDHARTPVAVRLKPDVAAEMLARSEHDDGGLERKVDDVLREWLRRNP